MDQPKFLRKKAKSFESIRDRARKRDGHCVDQQTVNQISSCVEKNGQAAQNAGKKRSARLRQPSFQRPIGLLEAPVAVQ